MGSKITFEKEIMSVAKKRKMDDPEIYMLPVSAL